MTAGRPPIPMERRERSMRGDGQRPGGHRPGKQLAIRGSYTVSAPEPPDGIGERGRIEWQRIWAAGETWLHPAEDYHWVEQIAYAYDDIDRFREHIRIDGPIVKGYAGQKVANPLLHEIREAQTVIRRCLSQLGFSPADRVKLGLAEVQIQTGISKLQEKTKEKRSGR